MNTAVQKSQEIQRIEPQATALTPMDLLNNAVANGNLELAEKLMGLQERWEANQARKAFDEAVSAAKAKLKPVVRNRKGHNSKMYADFSAIAQAVDPILAEYGLSYRFRSSQGDKITVTCVLAHKGGHFEETSLSGPADTSGNKNAIQAIGSTLTYLQRYSLVQMLGIAASDDDDGAAGNDDGAAGNAGERISEDQTTELIDLCEAVSADRAKFCKYLKVESLADLPARRFEEAKQALEAKRKPS